MGEKDFSGEEINAFFSKLDTFATNLSDKERALLRAILDAATGSGTDPFKLDIELRSFQEEFSGAFKQNLAESIVAAYANHEVSSVKAIIK